MSDTKAISQMTPQELDAEIKRVKLEKDQLELEHLRTVVSRERAMRDAAMRAYESQQKSLDEYNANVKLEQSFCKHRKGGKNLEGILKGHDSNYSVIFHTYPWGELVVMCTRCGKEWRKPTAEMRKTDGKAYKAQMDEYTTALEFPTDNEPSGTQLFLIQAAKAS